MKHSLRLTTVLLAAIFYACTGNTQNKEAKKSNDKIEVQQTVNLTDAEWKAKLTPEQYYVLREKGTDRAGSGKYWLHHDKGIYSCAGCGQELFTSDMKFDSDCGWPSFDKEMTGGRVKQIKDVSFGMERIEIVCAKCGSHLGHIFDDGPTLTGQRYCVNSTSIDFKKGDIKKPEAKAKN